MDLRRQLVAMGVTEPRLRPQLRKMLTASDPRMRTFGAGLTQMCEAVLVAAAEYLEAEVDQSRGGLAVGYENPPAMEMAIRKGDFEGFLYLNIRPNGELVVGLAESDMGMMGGNVQTMKYAFTNYVQKSPNMVGKDLAHRFKGRLEAEG